MGEEPNHTTPRKTLIIFQSFNTLWGEEKEGRGVRRDGARDGKGSTSGGRKGGGEIKKKGFEEGREEEIHGLGEEKGVTGGGERVGTEGGGGRKDGISMRYRRDIGSRGGGGKGGGG